MIVYLPPSLSALEIANSHEQPAVVRSVELIICCVRCHPLRSLKQYVATWRNQLDACPGVISQQFETCFGS